MTDRPDDDRPGTGGDRYREREPVHHSSDGDQELRDRSSRMLVVSLTINTVFFLIVLVGALAAGSLTLLSEAAHMFTDSLSLVLALIAARIARWGPDAKRTFGYQRAEVLGGVTNALLLLLVVGLILSEAAGRFRDPPVVDAPVVIGIGTIGLVSNVAAAWVLLDHRNSLNVEGAFLHLVIDAAGSVAAVVLGVVLLFTDLYVLDPVFAVLIAMLVLYSAKDLLADSINILLQGTPRNVDIEEITAELQNVTGVESVHDVHVWALDSARTSLSAHVVVAADAAADSVLERTQETATEFGIDHITIQIESSGYSQTHELDCQSPSG